MKPLPPLNLLHEILEYFPETGILYWKPRRPSMFDPNATKSQDHLAKLWNSKNAGKEALGAISKQGYKVGNINCSLYRSHRVAYAMFHGIDPSDQIDHINGIRDDNRIVNLRVVDNQTNAWNQKKRSTNASGYNGVSFCKITQKWEAKLTVDGETVRLGKFDSPESANIARIAADKEYGFHPNHGVDR